ncbi:MAG: triose-phosphate isomerase [Flavobacteriales bacterium]|nr:triose-phosphate isomerase [Flavobacteriales bacterium]
MRKIVAGNWKMHKDREGTKAFVAGLMELSVPEGVEVIIAPPFPFLAAAVEQLGGSAIVVAAQNCHQKVQGAFTGEVSAAMLKSIGVKACIVGHSERRQYFGETDTAVGEKISALLENDITPIYCCGELKDERVAGRHFEVVTAQLNAAFAALSAEQLKRIVVAYEPVWAIGTGLTASAEQAQEMHAHIRSLLASYGEAVASSVPVLYGGSCKPDNAAELFANPDVNGGLIGGAALDGKQFAELIRIAGAH